MENVAIANNVWDMVKGLDVDIQFDIWKRLSRIFSKSKSKAEPVSDNKVMSDEEKLELFNSCVGAWDWPEEEYSTDQLIADIKDSNWEEYNYRLMKLIEENEDVFAGH